MLLGVFVAITLAGWLVGNAVLARDSGPTAEEDITAVIADLARFRKGDDSVLPEMREIADRCAQQHHRPDVQRIFKFYAGLALADRMRGAAEYEEFEQLYLRVKWATDEDISTASWVTLNDLVLADLGQFISRTIHSPDPAPAAYALGLCSTLKTQRVRKDNTITDEARDRLILEVIDDANGSIALFTRCGMQVPQIEPLLNLAWMEWAQARLNTAERAFTQVEGFARSANNELFQVQALMGLVSIATEHGDMQQRCKLLIKMASLGKEGLSWDLVKQQGQFLLELDEARMAVEWLARNQPEKEAEIQDWHFQMYNATSRAGMKTAALGHAQVVRQSARAAEVGSPQWIAVAEMDLKEGRAAEVLKRLDAVSQTWIDLRRPAAIARLRGAAQFDLGHYAEAANVLAEALQLSQERENWVTKFDVRSSTGSIVGEIIGLESVAKLCCALIASGNELDAATAIENWQCRSLRMGSGEPQDIDYQDLKAWAARFESGLVTWVIGADTSVVAYVGTNGHATATPLKVGRRSLENAIRLLREAVFDADSTKAYRYAEEIQSAILPENVLAQISVGGERRLLLCLHGPLESIPLDLLPLFRGDKASSLTPVVLPGLFARPDARTWNTNDGSSWCILGDPVAGLPDDSVPGASKELDGVAKLHPGATVHTGPAFDRENVLAALHSRTCIHIASHLISGTRSATSIDDSMSHAAILLSNRGRLSVDDIYDSQQIHDLAVLNACYTAGGEKVDAEPIQGIARAFLISGTRNVLVTMWPIEDGAAGRFALAFHEALNQGVSPSRAAMVARNELRSTGAALGEWAAFRVIGRD
jgi:hypothetical protein